MTNINGLTTKLYSWKIIMHNVHKQLMAIMSLVHQIPMGPVAISMIVHVRDPITNIIEASYDV